MKKVLVLTSTFPRWKDDSTPAFVFELCRSLAEKYEIHVLAPHTKNSRTHEAMDNVNVHRFEYMPHRLEKVAYGAGIIPNVKSNMAAFLGVPFFLVAEYFSACNIVEKLKPKILHAHWIIPQGVIGAWLSKKYKIPLIVTIHGSDLFPLKNKTFLTLQKYVLKNCKFCTINSTATKDELTRRFPQFNEKFILIPMGVDTNLFFPSKVKKEENTILFVGRLNEQKGVEYLIKAMKIVTAKHKDAQLIIIGDGSHKKILEKIAKESNVENNVQFLGPIPKKKLPDYYNKATLFVLPSVTSKIGTEGQGLVLLEAMACATSVIGTNSGGIKQIIKHGKNGLLVRERDEIELAHAINELLGDKMLRSRISKNSLEFIKKNYSWQIISKKFDDLYKSIK